MTTSPHIDERKTLFNVLGNVFFEWFDLALHGSSTKVKVTGSNTVS